tara:strand:+ start:29242 stop:30450 length:1209 start_codon:yes stop_codon:yes gene_type:complete
MAGSDKKNPLDLTDEELMQMSLEDMASYEEPDEDTSEDTDENEDAGQEPASTVSDEEDETDDEESEEDPEQEEEPADDEDDSEETDSEDDSSEESDDEEVTEKESDEEGEDDSDEESDEADPDDEIDYKAEYMRLTAPFRANGKDMQVKNVDEAITLMQMGANYNKKMAALKPNLKLMKMLDNEELLDEGKLSHLIDLSKKNPEAIAKLIKDANIDPLDLDLDKSSEYKPNTYTVNDKEVELDSTLEDLQGTPGFDRTIDVISNKWDENSRRFIVDNPGVIRVINEHMNRQYSGSTVYDTVTTEVERQKALGQLSGLSDIEAYKVVGDQIFGTAQQQQQKPAAAQKKTVKRSTSKAEDPKLKQKRKAASPTKTKASKKQDTNFNPLELPDDEIEKMVQGKFL